MERSKFDVPEWTALGLDHDFDSLIERDLAAELVKHLAPRVTLQNQFEIATPHGTFFLDFCVTRAGRRIAVETDGKDYHRERGWYDLLRDVAIIMHSDVDAIYRMKGKVVAYQLDDALYLISQVEPEFFSERGHLNIRRLSRVARNGADSVRINALGIEGTFQVDEYDRPGTPGYVFVRRMSRSDEFFEEYAAFLRDHPGTHVERLAELWQLRRAR